MASSEPRITALLEGASILPGSSNRPSLQLPPLQASLPTRALERPSPIEPTTGANKDVQNSTSRLDSHNSGEKGKSRKNGLENTAEKDKPIPKSPPRIVSPRDVLLNRFGEDGIDEAWPSAPRKKQKVETALLENLTVKLPQLQKKAQPARITVVPAISDLKTPPPTAARFPRITPSAFEDAHGRHALNGLPTPTSAPRTPKKAKKQDKSSSYQDTPPSPAKASPTTTQSQAASTRRRNKWTDGETDDLLQGVALFGVGCWKQILTHPGFTFINRSAIDLKDRFRTCCPKEYRKSLSTAEPTLEIPASTSDTHSLPSSSPHHLKKARKPRKTHRREANDLARLGIDAPFQKASRRTRHPFTDEEDASLLKGFGLYGPSWSRIQGSPSLNLHKRRATDLRDRFRNRFPDKYAEAGFKSKVVPNASPPSPEPSDALPSLVAEPSKTDSEMPGNPFESSSPSINPSTQPNLFTASTSAGMLYAPSQLPPLPIASSMLDWLGLSPFPPTFPSNLVSSTASGLGPVVDSTTDTQHPPIQLDPVMAPDLAALEVQVNARGTGWGRVHMQSTNLPPVGEVVASFGNSGATFTLMGAGIMGRNEVSRKEMSLSSLMWDDLATQPLFDTEGG